MFLLGFVAGVIATVIGVIVFAAIKFSDLMSGK